MSPESDPGPILYASISRGPTVLADLLSAAGDSSGGGAAAGELSALASTCLDAAPRFHLLYTHTASSRIYAFLMADPLLFFAIADESLGRSAVLLFLHRLRDATVSTARRRIVAAGDPLPQRCLQEELSPLIRRLAAEPLSPFEEEKPSLSPPPARSPSRFPSTPPSSDSILLTGEHKRKVKKERKKNSRSEEGQGAGDCRDGDELEISVTDDDGDADHGLGLGGRKSVQRIWRRQVRMVLIVDLVVCSLLFGIWLSVCKGFRCIGG